MPLGLTRRVGEVIWIGDDIKIIVTEISGKHVVLAIDAPKGLRIDRGEVRKRRNDEIAKASRG